MDLEEKKKQRLLKFGPVTTKENPKSAQKTVKQPNNTTLTVAVDPEILAKRQAKFGIVEPKPQKPVKEKSETKVLKPKTLSKVEKKVDKNQVSKPVVLLDPEVAKKRKEKFGLQ